MKNQQRTHDTVKRLLLVCYGAMMLYLLFVRGRSIESELPYWQRIAINYNLVPFSTVWKYWDILARPEYYLEKFVAYAIYKAQAEAAIVNLVGNVVMFIPLGYFLPAIWQKLRKLGKTVLTGAVIIVLIEVAQLLSLRGYCDIDDLILNVLGIMAGYLFWRITFRMRCKRK